MTSIRRVIRRQYYPKINGGKTEYARVRFRLEFPEGFPVSDLVGEELEFERLGREVRLKPKGNP